MKKPALCIDAFLTDENRHEIFNYNVSNFIKAGWDVFVISNKIHHFDSFKGVKYFEYDSHNRVLPNRNRYELLSWMNYHFNLFEGSGKELKFSASEQFHGFTNWTLLYNLRRMAEVVKRFGHTHMVSYEYDIVAKNYNLMDTVYKDFGKTENSLNCMVRSGPFGCYTYTYLINVDTVLNTIPVMETEDDYEQFITQFYGRPVSPVYEQLFCELFVKFVDDRPTTAAVVSEEDHWSGIDNIGIYMSEADVGTGGRSAINYRNLLLCPVNNNKEFFVFNKGSKQVFVDYKTGSPRGINSGYVEQFYIDPGHWRILPAKDSVEVVTSEMLPYGDKFTFDLNTWQYNCTIAPV